MEPRPRMRQSGVVIGPRSGRMGYRDDREDVTGDIEPPKLLDQVRQRLRVKHYSLRTEQAYVGWIRRFILANGKRHPREMRSEEHTSELQSLMRISYAVVCLKK